MSFFRNYRFVMVAFATIMLLFLIKTSTTSKHALDLNAVLAPAPGNNQNTDSSISSGSSDFQALPIEETPGYVADEKTESTSPQVADAVKGQIQSTCNKEHQFVVMIDAGSTGSRVHVYEFDACTQPPTLIEETFKMLKPGLSSFDSDAVGAAKSLDPLLEVAMETIPEGKRNCSPVAVKATAGLRMLGDAKASKILDAVRSRLEEHFPFPVVEGDGVSIMGGDEEGVYAWITTNYLLGNIGAGSKMPTSAVFDLGGGSTQIVFEPTFQGSEHMVEGEHKYELTFGGQNYELYQFSHLGYGLMQGRNKINSLLVKNAIKNGSIKKGDLEKTHNLTSPCLPPGQVVLEEKVKLDDGETYIVNFNGPVRAAGAQCRFLADSILNKDAECTTPPCSFNGVHQPSLVRTFKETNDLYIFSYFYDRTQPLGMPSSFTLEELADLAKMVCNGEEVWESIFSSIDGSLEELKQEPQWCLDLSFQVSLLHTGYDIPLHRELRTAKTIANNELGWCLGASLPLLEADTWSCKVKQIN